MILSLTPPHTKILYLIGIFGGLLFYANAQFEHLPITDPIDKIVVEKSQRKLFLLKEGEVVKAYPISLGANPIGTKKQEGDERTPEGNYVIDYKKSDSAFHLALHVSYPTPRQIDAAQREGYDAGGMIMIHGIKNGFGWIGRLHRLLNWTNGCIAVTNPEIEEIYRSTPTGTPIEIRP